MDQQVKSFTFYLEYADLISLLSEEEQSSLYLKIINYIFYGKEVDNLTNNQNKVWINLKRPIDKSISQSKNVSRRYSNNTNDNTKEDTKEDTQSKMYMSNVNCNMSNSNSNKSKLNKSKELDSKYENEFETIWEIYPNKKGKDQAKKKYISARYQGVSYDEILKGLKDYVEYCKHEELNKRYIKHGSTWFNQQCWKDDYSITESNKADKSAYKSKAEREEEAIREFYREHGVEEDE